MRRVANLKRQIAFYKQVVRQRQDAVLLTDERGRVTECSIGVEQLLGWPVSEVRDKNLFAFFAELGEAVFWREIEVKLGRDGGQIAERRAFTRRGGGTIELLFSLEVVREGRDCFGMIFVGKDVSREVELEAQLRRAIAKLEVEKRTDPLTGLRNRRFFDERVSEEVGRATRFHHALSLLFVDVDDFKARVNTPHGHTVGDRVLATVASVLGASVRETDFLARYAGDEFVIISPETNKNGALTLAEKIRGAVEKASIILRENGQRIAVTVSVGVATFIPSGTVEGLVGKASRAALQAKTHGRNQVWDADRKAGQDAFVI